MKIRPFGIRGDDVGRRVDMSLDEMPAEASVCPQGPLQIHPRSGLQSAEVGAVQCFDKQIERYAIILACDGEAAAIHGKALTK